MRIKELKRTVNVSWSPGEQYPVLLAAGSAAQQVDATFSSSSQLELYGLNLEDPGLDLELKASIQTQHKFQKLVWSGAGVIVGGCDGGLLEFYSVEKLLKNTPEALIGSCTKHNGPISALDINPYQRNLLASGASDSEIFIWDINNTSQPMAPGNKTQPQEHVQGLAWNQQVQHILGSTFATRCVVWDLRKNEPIMKLSDTQSRTRWRSLAWHPSVATQLCIASEDDQGPVVQLWDLRLAASPLVTLEGHHKGVLSVSWCKQEPDLLLSAGKDGRVLCWNPNDTRPRGSLLCELSSQPQWVFDVSWCPRSPALFAAAGFDQDVAVHSLLGGSSRAGNSTISNNNIMDSFGAASFQQLPAVAAPALAAVTQAAPAPPQPPAWLRRPAASKFSFGGKLVTFEKCPQEAGSQKLVYVSQVVSEPEVVEQAAELDTLLSLCRDPTATDRLAEYCRQKGEAATDQNERYTWFFLRANFLPTFRSEVLNLLGFKQDEIPSKFKGPSAVSGDYNHIDNNIDSITSGIAGLSRDAHTLIERKLSAVDTAPAVKNVSIPTGEDSTSLICRAMILGNLEEAVELCLEAKRVTDALVIASLGSQELLNKVQKYHLNSTSGEPVSLLAGTLLLSRWDALVRSAATHNWRDVLAAIVTHCEGDALSHYCESLGDKLSSDTDPSLATPATICYLIGMSAPALLARLGSTVGMQGALTELALLSQSAAVARGRQTPAGSKIDSVLNEFALRLSSQGCLQSALNILESAGQSELRDRLQRALGLLQQQRRTSGHPQPQQFVQRTRTTSHTRQQYQHDNTASHARQQYQHENTTYNTVQAPSYTSPWGPPAAPAPHAPPAPPAQPPRPASVGPQSGGITSRSKYKVDPSVQAAPQYGQYSFTNPAPAQPPYGGYNSPIPDQYSSTTVPNNNFAQNNNFGPAVPNNNFAPINPYNPNAYNPNSNPANPGQGNPVGQGNPLGGNPVNGSYYGEPAPAPAPSKPMQPGWNDPPMMQAKPKQKSEPVAAQAPITHPLFGTEPPQHIPLNPVPGSQQYPGQYPVGQQYPAQNYQYPGQDAGYQQYGQQGQGYQQGYGPPAGVAPAYPQKADSPAPAPAVEAVPKGPVPDEHLALQTTFDTIRQECANHTNNPAMKRKLEEVQKKLENLYDLLREYRLSEGALSALHSCAHHATAGDCGAALSLATALASGPDFATVASFLPGLKTLLQLRQQTMGR